MQIGENESGIDHTTPVPVFFDFIVAVRVGLKRAYPHDRRVDLLVGPCGRRGECMGLQHVHHRPVDIRLRGPVRCRHPKGRAP
jgi:hypothetical protein